MILVDTSIWIDHLRKVEPQLVSLLDANLVLMHPLVYGELAMGALKPRVLALRFFNRLPEMIRARDRDVLGFVDAEQLFGTGLNFIDAHLLTSVRMQRDAQLWTRDRRLLAVAGRLSMAAPFP